jgi:hypothetical protein
MHIGIVLEKSDGLETRKTIQIVKPKNHPGAVTANKPGTMIDLVRCMAGGLCVCVCVCVCVVVSHTCTTQRVATRRKIRLIESNAKCRHLKRGFAAGVYLAEPTSSTKYLFGLF